MNPLPDDPLPQVSPRLTMRDWLSSMAESVPVIIALWAVGLLLCAALWNDLVFAVPDMPLVLTGEI